MAADASSNMQSILVSLQPSSNQYMKQMTAELAPLSIYTY